APVGRFRGAHGLGRIAPGHAAKRFFQILRESRLALSSPYGRTDPRNTARRIATYPLASAGPAQIAFPHAQHAASRQGPHARHVGPARLHLPERCPALVGEYPTRRPSQSRRSRTYVSSGAAAPIQRHAGSVLCPCLKTNRATRRSDAPPSKRMRDGPSRTATCDLYAGGAAPDSTAAHSDAGAGLPQPPAIQHRAWPRNAQKPAPSLAAP